MIDSPVVFDSPAYLRINRAREAWLRRVITLIPFRNELRTALDVGCGAGYFSNVLIDLGFSVTGVDLRQSNIEICRQRYPQCAFLQADLDQTDALEGKGLATHDLALVFGFLYHVQSPLQTIDRLAQHVNRLCIVSTRVARGDAMACYLYRENKGDAQNSKRVVAVPTVPAVFNIFAEAGFSFQYQVDFQPDHEQWNPSKTPDGLRFSFIASREPMKTPALRRLSAPKPLQKWKNLPREA
jgi:SAM-dependent methyltransferase